MPHSVLIIDDDPFIHMFLDSFIKPEFNTHHAETAQEAIDILSQQTINLIITDIHMPGLSGLEFLESIRQDRDKASIPLLIITSLPTKEKRDKALGLGAVDFLPKDGETFSPEHILERVRMKLLSDIQLPHIKDEQLNKRKQKIVSHFMINALTQSFEVTADALCQSISDQFNLSLCFLSVMKEGQPNRLSTVFKDNEFPTHYTDQSFADEPRLQNITSYKEGYLSNHAFGTESGVTSDIATDYNLPAEIIVPIYQIQEREFLISKQIPDDAIMFAFIVMKRDVLFSSEEFDIISVLVRHAGPILWRLYSRQSD